MDRREHHRAQLRLPVRLRWSTPFGQKTEVCKTLDISRGGLLVPCNEAHALGVPLWVTFPYDPSLRDGQPEMLAKVVRVTPGSNGFAASAPLASANKLTNVFEVPAVALHFQPAFHPESNSNGHAKEREQSPRTAATLALFGMAIAVALGVKRGLKVQGNGRHLENVCQFVCRSERRA